MSNMNNLDIPVVEDIKDFAEVMAKVHYSVATSSNREIADDIGKPYIATKSALFVAIGTAYPEVDIKAIYRIWIDCNESIAYCVDWYKADKAHGRDMALQEYIEDIQDHLDESDISHIKGISDNKAIPDNRDNENLRAMYGNSDMRNAMRKPYNS